MRKIAAALVLLACSASALAVPAVVVSPVVVEPEPPREYDNVIRAHTPPVIIDPHNVVVEECGFEIVVTPECEEDSARYRILLEWQSLPEND